MFEIGKKIQVKVNDELAEPFFINRLRPALFSSHHYKTTKKVSFCTVIGPSDNFLLQTLPSNLEANHRDRSFVDFVILVPEGWEKLSRVKKEFSDELKSSYLKIACYDENLKAGELRNLCFQLATGTILSNLETSDYTGNRAGNFIYNELTSTHSDATLSFRQRWREPSRIALWRDTFYEIGGFDEEKPYNRQCSNLISRLNQYGVESLIRSNAYFTKSLLKPRLSVFDPPFSQKVRKLKMAKPEKYGIQLI